MVWHYIGLSTYERVVMMENKPPTFPRKYRFDSGSIPIRRGDESSHFSEIEQTASAVSIKEIRDAEEVFSIG